MHLVARAHTAVRMSGLVRVARNMSCISIDKKIVMLINGVARSDSGGLKMSSVHGVLNFLSGGYLASRSLM